jgi:hypothetical protein
LDRNLSFFLVSRGPLLRPSRETPEG